MPRKPIDWICRWTSSRLCGGHRNTRLAGPRAGGSSLRQARNRRHRLGGRSTRAWTADVGAPVKGAYWDSEIKRRKSGGSTAIRSYAQIDDRCVLPCLRRPPIRSWGRDLRAIRDPQCAHDRFEAGAGAAGSLYEFQRLHGMGGTVVAEAARQIADFPPVRTYGAGRGAQHSVVGAKIVGEWREYLVRQSLHG